MIEGLHGGVFPHSLLPYSLATSKQTLRSCQVTARGAQFDALDRMVLLKDSLALAGHMWVIACNNSKILVLILAVVVKQ